MDIEYRIGDATNPSGEGNKIICHVCNDIGGWGAGFVLAISKRWKKPEEAYRTWHKAGESAGFELGAVQLVQVEKDIWVANLIGQRGVSWENGQPPIRYEAVETALERIAEEAMKLNASAHMPRIGCGLAGGTWEEIGAIVNRRLCQRGLCTNKPSKP